MTRWEGLFADLEGQIAATQAGETAAEVDARTRGEQGEVTLGDRLRGALGQPVRVVAAGGLVVSGVLRRVGPDWVCVVEETGREALLPLAALRQVGGLTRWVQPSPGGVGARLGWRSALRAVARDRSAVRVHLVDGEVVDATVDRVGADHLDLAVHAPGETRRRREVRGVVAVPFAAVAAVRREGPDPD